MTALRRLASLVRAIVRPASARREVGNPAHAAAPVRTSLRSWSDNALRNMLTTIAPGTTVGYFAFYPGERRIDDFTGLYVTVTALPDGSFRRRAGNHGRSDAVRSCTADEVLFEMATGRGSDDAFIDTH